MKVRIAQEPWSADYGIQFYVQHDGYRTVMEPVRFRAYVVKEGDVSQGPTISLDPFTIKSLADELARLGVKTEDTHKIEGVLEATKKHLEDMRSIVFLEISKDEQK